MADVQEESDLIREVAEAVWEDDPTPAELDLTRRIVEAHREVTRPARPAEKGAASVIASALAEHQQSYDPDDLPTEFHGYAYAVLRALASEGYRVSPPASTDGGDDRG